MLAHTYNCFSHTHTDVIKHLQLFSHTQILDQAPYKGALIPIVEHKCKLSLCFIKLCVIEFRMQVRLYSRTDSKHKQENITLAPTNFMY